MDANIYFNAKKTRLFDKLAPIPIGFNVNEIVDDSVLELTLPKFKKIKINKF